ncbi:MAG: hypothetical protein ACFE8B_01870 [Candidatus Hermodarchaeota archaeon]
MTVHKLKPKDLTICTKCGNVMITRRIRTNNSKELEFQKILQCIVCRHWIADE